MPDNSREDMALALREATPTGGDGGQSTEVTVIDAGEPAGQVVERQEAREVAPSPPAARTDGRDHSGRFAPKTPAQESVSADTKPAGQVKTVVAAPKPGAVAAPVSWKPEEREGWDKLSPVHQAAVVRREREVEAALRTSADARALQTEFNRAVQPYLPMIQAENSTPIRTFEYLLQTAAALRTATPGNKAALVHDLIRQFNVDVSMLDGMLVASHTGQPHRQSSPMDLLLAEIDKRFKPVTEFMNGVGAAQQQTEQQLQAQAAATWEAFASDPANEFAKDLEGDMADLLTLAANRGQHMTLQDAYSRAILAHPTISKVLADRQQAVGATQQTAAARRALEAAASVTGSTGGAPRQGGEDEGDGSLRSDIMSSISALSQRR